MKTIAEIKEAFEKGQRFFDVDESLYHNPTMIGVSRSDIVALLKSYDHYQWQKEHPLKETDALVFGKACHAAILEPEKFAERFAMIPDDLNRRTKEGKAAYEKLQADNPGKTLLHEEDYDTIARMMDKVHSHPKARALLKGKKEKTFLWKDKETGVICRTRPDVFCDDLKTIVDLKTCSDASTRSFSHDCAKFLYHIQHAFYLDGINTVQEELGQKFAYDNFAFVCVEKTPPFGVKVYHLDEEAIKRGRELYQKGLNVFKNPPKYRGYSTEVEELRLPVYAFFDD